MKQEKTKQDEKLKDSIFYTFYEFYDRAVKLLQQGYCPHNLVTAKKLLDICYELDQYKHML